MNYIDMAVRLRKECGVSGGNTSVTNATGEWGRLCDWIATAWAELQQENPNWNWMRKNVTFNTVASQGEYAPDGAEIALTDFGSWREKSFRAYLTSAGIGSEQLLSFKEYGQFRDYYLLASRRTTYSRPTEITVAPNQNLILGLAPSDIYTVTGEYYKTPQVLFVDADIPEMPTRFHMAIVYRAMMSYGAFESANEVYQRGDKQYREMISKITFNQSPKLTYGGSFI